MSPPTSFEPNPVSAPPKDPKEAPSTENVAPQTVTIPPEQLDALGLTGATAGQSYTITVTVNRADEQGADLTVESSEANLAPSDEGNGDLPPDPMGDEPPPDLMHPPARPKPSIVGPGRFAGKL